MKKYQIGIIGYGDFTKLMCEYLSPYADVIVSSRQRDAGEAGFGARFAPLQEVLSQSIIIPSFPSQFFESFFKAHGHLVNKDALVIDVCSVKVRPLAVLERFLPETCQIIGTHPMFGPASVAQNKGIQSLRCVVSPVRASSDSIDHLVQFLSETLKLRVLHYTPEAHDKMMAYVQGLSHYVARIMDALDIPNTDLETLAYADLVSMKNIQGQDSWDLFMSIMHDNPYAMKINEEFKNAMVQLDIKIQDTLKIES